MRATDSGVYMQNLSAILGKVLRLVVISTCLFCTRIKNHLYIAINEWLLKIGTIDNESLELSLKCTTFANGKI